ncbi:putative Long-chain fatty acid transport protein [Thiobacillus denitrificans ATCC 25259]|uniref:Putative Long-chain fatty acid transport protein n=1 Tax=Thiobacillus denitrificans (strain ATCC 25259 / T1) TaxID=292415 RepID=Q3SGW0_THIDA|nr:outer membrane protein transport protein [Thiobacillus denitrificans]AAZ98133.1 putative Long-chain fatty acid transport protein [Thiobacillus denitrificans ATCC 25259]
MNKKLFAAVSAALAGFAANAHATNGDQMLGVTATQWGMGGAIVAAPQDAATLLYNPAGLATLGIKDVRFDMGVGVLNPPRKVNGQDSDSDYYLMPAGAVAFNVDDKLFLGLNMGGVSGSGVDFADVRPLLAGTQAVVTTKQSYKIAPGFAYRFSDRLALGAALQIGYQSLAIHNNAFTLPQTQVYGVGMNAGVIYKFNEAVQLGASWTSKTSMDEFQWNTTAGPYSMTLDMPQVVALGVAFRPMPGLLIEADVKRIGFQDVLDRVPFETPGGASTMNFGWDDQTVYAIGVQKQINDKTTVRAGFNYGKSPIGEEDVDNNIGSLAITEKHLSLGITREFSDKVSGSLAYTRAFHNEITSNTGSNTTIELEQNIVNLQVSYKY